MIKLKNHPFSVEAFFKSSVVLTFAVKKDELNNLIPECLELDTFQEEWGFVAVAMVQTKNLRPKGFPAFLGNDFFLIGFRIFVKYQSNSGKTLRGLYIIKSETNKIRMQFFGNIFTHYNYTTTDIEEHEDESTRVIKSNKSDFLITIDKTTNQIEIPKGSPFSDWKEARKFAGPLPNTFTYNEKSKEVLIIHGVRKNWRPKPLEISNYHISFLDSLKFNNYKLANAFEITDIPYHWKKGRLEKWQ